MSPEPPIWSTVKVLYTRQHDHGIVTSRATRVRGDQQWASDLSSDPILYTEYSCNHIAHVSLSVLTCFASIWSG